MRELRLRGRLDLVLLPAAQPLPEPGHRLQSHPQTKIIRKAHPPLLRLSTTHGLQPATSSSPGSTLPVTPIDRGLLRLFPAKRAALSHRRPGPGNGALAVGSLVLARARALRPTAFTPTAFAGKTTIKLRRSYGSNTRSVVCVELCTIGTLLIRRTPGALSTADPRPTKGTRSTGRSMISDCTGTAARVHDLREIVNVILYVNRTGIPWEYLPHDFPPYKLPTVQNRLRLLREVGSGRHHRAGA
ncbi:hypothetical protein GCM10009544_03810 [Streptomyces stramineus]|uniref:Insertion element IS402-like domain-containing protein n=1 Tax=Streptomyces stramineus TaxID=173861 RepID=A0ABN0ZDI6_9ACTN